MKKISVLILLFLSLVGCGTTVSLTGGSDGVISFGLKESKCNQLPYIYSGIVYDFCVLNGEPNYVSLGPAAFALIGADFILSGAADTLVLPYTIGMQSSKKYILVSKR